MVPSSSAADRYGVLDRPPWAERACGERRAGREAAGADPSFTGLPTGAPRRYEQRRRETGTTATDRPVSQKYREAREEESQADNRPARPTEGPRTDVTGAAVTGRPFPAARGQRCLPRMGRGSRCGSVAHLEPGRTRPGLGPPPYGVSCWIHFQYKIVIGRDEGGGRRAAQSDPARRPCASASGTDSRLTDRLPRPVWRDESARAKRGDPAITVTTSATAATKAHHAASLHMVMMDASGIRGAPGMSFGRVVDMEA